MNHRAEDLPTHIVLIRLVSMHTKTPTNTNHSNTSKQIPGAVLITIKSILQRYPELIRVL